MKNLDSPVAVRGRLPTAAARKRHKGGSKWREDNTSNNPRQYKNGGQLPPFSAKVRREMMNSNDTVHRDTLIPDPQTAKKTITPILLAPIITEQKTPPDFGGVYSDHFVKMQDKNTVYI